MALGRGLQNQRFLIYDFFLFFLNKLVNSIRASVFSSELLDEYSIAVMFDVVEGQPLVLEVELPLTACI